VNVTNWKDAKDDMDRQVAAVRKAYEACQLGDVPDMPQGIVALLRVDGWEVRKRPLPTE
jgi:hypothetical protein